MDEEPADPVRAAGMLTIKQAADLVGVTPTAVHHALRSGRVKGRRIGPKWGVEQASALAWRDRRRARARTLQARPEDQMTVPEAAREFEVSYNVLLRAVQLGRMPSVTGPGRISYRYTVRRQDVRRWLEARRLPSDFPREVR